MAGLWGAEFDVPKKEDTKKLVRKAETKKSVNVEKEKIVKSKSVSILDKLRIIESEVDRILGVYKENTEVLYTEESVVSYFDDAIKSGVIAVDTETNNSLDPLTCKLMGLCIYTPSRKQAYVPVNHVSLDGTHLDNQATEQFLKTQLDRIKNIDCIFHNGKFDYQVLKCTTGSELPITWDTMIGARILNENEKAGLKEQYVSKIDPSIEKYSIEYLFGNIPYEYVSPEVFALYAATDSYMTYKLYLWQKEQFEKAENAKMYKLFLETEMPLTPVLASMELTGMCIDLDYADRLSKKYHLQLEEIDKKIDKELANYNPLIQKFKNSPEGNVTRNSSRTLGEQIQIPMNVGSSTQLAILIYDVLKIKPVDKSSPRGTGEGILEKIKENNPDFTLGDLILQRRSLVKLINTYIDKLVKCISTVDNRLHANFNQCGADTGRLSSSDPNLQNIPSKNNEIRMLFVADKGKVFIGNDYSQQEPRLLAQYSEDETMIGSYQDGKDLYSLIASEVYHNNYEDNREFRPDGTFNPEGKHRRSSVKNILLGMMYGRGAAAIAEQINDGVVTKEAIAEANHIIRSFYDSFPKVEKWMDETVRNAKINGYVEDLWGRRRRLPDIQLPAYKVIGAEKETFNPLLHTTGLVEDNSKTDKWLEAISRATNAGEKNKIKYEASKEGITIKDNGGFIAQAERQCVNARIQGGAATMSKRAMVAIHNDPELNAMGFKIVNAVHDEIIGEVGIEYQEQAAKRMSELMMNAAKPECIVPMKCDASIFHAWYEDVYGSDLKKEFEKLKDKLSEEEALQELYRNHTENTVEIINSYLNG